jgi:hypothetical protein
MALLTKSYLSTKARKASPNLSEEYIRSFSATDLALSAKSASATDTFDIFLSHAKEDAILIKGLRDELVENGYTVYVDWIDDPRLDRSRVTKETAAILRGRMRQSRCLLFASSESSTKSVWMPWELGYMDAFTSSRVAVVPMVEDADASKDFIGQEYLGLYPYLDKTGTSFRVHTSAVKYTQFPDWLRGTNP